jgi:hypothetical protein
VIKEQIIQNPKVLNKYPDMEETFGRLNCVRLMKWLWGSIGRRVSGPQAPPCFTRSADLTQSAIYRLSKSTDALPAPPRQFSFRLRATCKLILTLVDIGATWKEPDQKFTSTITSACNLGHGFMIPSDFSSFEFILIISYL